MPYVLSYLAMTEALFRTQRYIHELIRLYLGAEMQVIHGH